jgi:hypothetical protein
MIGASRLGTLDWELDGDGFWAQVGNFRQRVTVIQQSDLLLRSRVARPAILNRVSDPELRGKRLRLC